MKVMTLVRVGLLAVLAGVTLSAQNLNVELQRVTQQEIVTGDLRAAIDSYKKIVARAGSNREVAAQALVRMAESYQKLGDVEARTIYARLIRDFSDQKDAVAIARARLGSTAPETTSTAMAFRKRWEAGPRATFHGTVSPDGRYISYVDSATRDLALHDLITNTDRRLTNKGTWAESGEYAFWSVISRDGKQVAYCWFNGQDRFEVRVVDLATVGVPRPQRLFDNEEVSYIAPKDWSPDGKWLAVQLRRKDRTEQIGLLGVQDGSLHVLKSTDWGGATNTKILFSPDGKYLTFDLPVSDARGQRDVFVLGVDGAREVSVVNPAYDKAMGWSPDGRHLLFASDRGGSVGLWALPVADGKPQGTPALVKSNTGWMTVHGTSTAGHLYLGLGGTASDIQVASVDFKTGRLLTPPSGLVESFMKFNRDADWSPDGKYLAHISAPRDIAIDSSDTGQVTRVVQPKLQYGRSLRWAPDGRSFVSEATDLKGRDGVYQIDAQTGESTPIAVSPPGGGFFAPQWSPDGKKIYYRSRLTGTDRDTHAFIERDLASGHEREMIRQTGLNDPSLSPDGRYIAARGGDDPSNKSSVVRLIPVAGGEPRDVIRASPPQGFGGFVGWAPDSRSVIVFQSNSADYKQSEVLLVSIADGEARKLDLATWRGGPISVHPDGRRVAFTVEQPNHEVWELENFLPALNAKK